MARAATTSDVFNAIAEPQRREILAVLRAGERPVTELAREMEGDYRTNLAAMGIETIDHFPRATENMPEIIGFINDLIEKGFAYAAQGGDVYFDVGKDHEYGKLSRREVAALQGEGGTVIRTSFDESKEGALRVALGGAGASAAAPAG